MEKEIKNILVIRFRRVGDSVLSMGLCHTLRKSFPGAEIDLVINKGIDSLYRSHPDVDNLIVFDKDENDNIFRHIAKIRHTMRAKRYDIIVDMRSTVKSLLFSLFSLRTPYRLGRKKWYSRLLLTHTADNHAAGTGTRPEQNLLLLKPLEKIADIHYSTDFRLYVTGAEKRAFAERMMQCGIDFSHPVAVVAVATRVRSKAWPMDAMTETLHRMMEHCPDIQLVFNYAGDEREIAMEQYKALGMDSRIFMNIEACSLRELCAMLSCSTFFFGNEGGPRHMAQALGIPSFAIFPPGIRKATWLCNENSTNAGVSPDDYLTPQEQDALKMQYGERMGLITVDRVWERLEIFLDSLPNLRQ